MTLPPGTVAIARTAAAGLLFSFVLGVGGAPADAQSLSDRQVPETREQINLSFAPVVKRVAPAVVNIFTSRTVELRRPSLFDDPFFKRFFGDAFPMPQQQRRRMENSLGSGVIVDPSGIVVTNAHVIAGADEIEVVLADRREFVAELLLADDKTDLAVLRIRDIEETLPTIELRDSDEIEVGDLVLAIGNPFGIGQTVTSGIVSAKARTRTGISDLGFFIQTDADINPGNSGGALVGLDGRLVGVNSAIFSRSGGSHGIGFAIPTNMVRTVIAGAMQGGRLVRPWLGAVGQTVNADMAVALGLEKPLGMIVDDMHRDGPAQAAGLARGDVIVAIDGKQVDDAESLRFRLATHPVGGKVPLEVIRDGDRLVLTLSLDAPPETPPRAITLLDGRHPLAGATVANLSPAFAIELGLPAHLEGVIALRIASRSPAARLGLNRGDIMLSVNGRDIDHVDVLSDLLERPAPRWKIRVRRGERVLAVTVDG